MNIIFYILSFLLAFCSMMHEFIIAKAMVSLSTNTVIPYTLTIGVYLISMGAGAFVFQKFSEEKKHWKFLWETEIILSLLGALAVIWIYAADLVMMHFWMNMFFSRAVVIFFVSAFLVAALVGFLTGIELPLLIALSRQRGADITNKILAWDYFGSLFGTVIFAFAVLPYADLIPAGFLTAFLNLGVGCFVYFVFLKKDASLGPAHALTAAVFAAAVFVCFQAPDINQYFLKRFYYFNPAAKSIPEVFAPKVQSPDVERYRSVYQDIDLIQVEEPPEPYRGLNKVYSRKFYDEPDYPADYVFFLDRALQFFSGFDELYHEYFAHIPVMLNGRVPENVLILGAGDGLLLKELLKYTGVRRVTLVEMDPKVLALAKNHPVLSRMNRHAFKDKRVQVVTADAFRFVQEHPLEYDAVYMDFPTPFSYDLSKLYSREFYHFVKNSLKDGGFMAMDAPQVSLKKNTKGYRKDLGIYFDTLRAAGFQNVKPFHTLLESDNLEALSHFQDILQGRREMTVQEFEGDRFVKKVIRGQSEIKKKILEDYLKNYEQFFFAAWKTVPPIEGGGYGAYRDFSFPLYVLNKDRFASSLLSPEDIVDSAGDQVNTLMKPRLPDFDLWWRLKMPF